MKTWKVITIAVVWLTIMITGVVYLNWYDNVGSEEDIHQALIRGVKNCEVDIELGNPTVYEAIANNFCDEGKIEDLLGAGADPHGKIDGKELAVILAIQGTLKALELFIEAGIDLEKKYLIRGHPDDDAVYGTLLMASILPGDLDREERRKYEKRGTRFKKMKLLGSRKNINTPSSNGHIALVQAMKRSEWGEMEEVVQYLTEELGANPGITDKKGENGFTVALNWCNTDIAFYLWAKAPNAHRVVDIEGRTPLMKLMSNLNCSSNYPDNLSEESEDFLHRYKTKKCGKYSSCEERDLTQFSENIRIAGFLSEGNINAQDNEGKTALFWTCESDWGGENREHVKLLLQKNADPKIADKNGVTPLTTSLTAFRKESSSTQNLLTSFYSSPQ